MKRRASSLSAAWYDVTLLDRRPAAVPKLVSVSSIPGRLPPVLYSAGTCAAIRPASAGAVGSRFVQPMAENRLGMGGSPAVWQHFFQARIICMEAEKQVADIDPRLNAMTLEP